VVAANQPQGPFASSAVKINQPQRKQRFTEETFAEKNELVLFTRKEREGLMGFNRPAGIVAR
jgi:hypothetical protein